MDENLPESLTALQAMVDDEEIFPIEGSHFQGITKQQFREEFRLVFYHLYRAAYAAWLDFLDPYARKFTPDFPAGELMYKFDQLQDCWSGCYKKAIYRQAAVETDPDEKEFLGFFLGYHIGLRASGMYHIYGTRSPAA